MPARHRLRPPGLGTALVLAALLLRLWGTGHGLPIAYNSDEDSHFVPGAVALFGHGWNPHYFANPPGLTYALHVLYAVVFGGGERFARDPGAYFLAARILVAVIGAAGVALLARAGRLLFDRATGLLAGLVLAVGFLPVFYSHLGLNDVPAMSAVCLALLATARVLRRGWALDYALAGAAVGLAAATKYTAGLALLPLVFATLASPHRSGRRLLGGLGAALLAFLLVNPYALLDLSEFRAGLSGQAGLSGVRKLGRSEGSALPFYLGAAGWGMGVIPALAAVAGAVLLAIRDRVRALMLLSPLLLFAVTVGLEARFFGRYLLPVVPVLALLAAHAARALARRGVPLLLLGVLLAGQGLVQSVRLDRILSRPDARNEARAWLRAHVPLGSRVVFEPTLRESWSAGYIRYPPPFRTRLDEYELALSPGFLDAYRRRGFCYVVTDSNSRGRAEAEPRRALGAIAYYAVLERQSRLLHVASPFGGARPPRVDFDASYQFRGPFTQPGSEIRIYRLRDCRER